MIEVDGVTKVFGPSKNIARALSMLSDSIPRADIRKKTGCLVAVDNVSLSVREGELFVLMGLSGSGKSTLIRCLNGIVRSTRGSVTVAGKTLDPRDRRSLIATRRVNMAMVFQHFALLPHRTVRDNAGFGLELQGVSLNERRATAEEALRRVGLGDWGDSLPSQLSGGMQQRVGLARALATGAPVLLMDEPFSALDPLIRREMQDELLRLQRELGRTIVFVTHDPNEAMKLGDRIGIMREGLLVQVGTSEEILSHSADDYVRQFIEDIDRGRALTASAIMRNANPITVNTGPRQAMRHLRQSGLSSVFVVEPDNRLKGILRIDKLVSAMEKGMDSIRDVIDDRVLTAGVDDAVYEVARGLATERVPAAVLDAEHHLLGIITWVDIVATIGGTPMGEDDSVPEGGDG